MDNDAQHSGDTPDYPVFNLVGNGVAGPDGDRAVHDDVHVNQDAGADIAGSDFVDVKHSVRTPGNIRYFFLDVLRGSGINQFTDAGPDNFKGSVQDENRYNNSTDEIQKRP